MVVVNHNDSALLQWYRIELFFIFELAISTNKTRRKCRLNLISSKFKLKLRPVPGTQLIAIKIIARYRSRPAGGARYCKLTPSLSSLALWLWFYGTIHFTNKTARLWFVISLWACFRFIFSPSRCRRGITLYRDGRYDYLFVFIFSVSYTL